LFFFQYRQPARSSFFDDYSRLPFPTVAHSPFSIRFSLVLAPAHPNSLFFVALFPPFFFYRAIPYEIHLNQFCHFLAFTELPNLAYAGQYRLTTGLERQSFVPEPCTAPTISGCPTAGIGRHTRRSCLFVPPFSPSPGKMIFVTRFKVFPFCSTFSLPTHTSFLVFPLPDGPRFTLR